MSEDLPDRASAWEELERRRVLRVAVAYTVAAFAALQGAQLWLVAGPGSEEAFRFMLGIATLGFPVAIVLAWKYDVTPEGIQVTPEDATEDPTYDAGPAKRWTVFVTLSALIGVVLWTLGR
jgi:hypothetical protein